MPSRVKFENIEDGRTILWNAEAEFVLGRGEQSGCLDKRVSRHHASFKILSDGILMTALHSNPCFFMKDGIPPMTVVKKEEFINVRDGDCIGLLPKSWYKISVIDEHNVSAAPTKNSSQHGQAVDTILEVDDMTIVRPGTPPTPDNVLPSDMNVSASESLCVISTTNSTTPEKFNSEITEKNQLPVNRSESPSLCPESWPSVSRTRPSWMVDDGPPYKKLTMSIPNSSLSADSKKHHSRGDKDQTSADTSALKYSEIPSCSFRYSLQEGVGHNATGNSGAEMDQTAIKSCLPEKNGDAVVGALNSAIVSNKSSKNIIAKSDTRISELATPQLEGPTHLSEANSKPSPANVQSVHHSVVSKAITSIKQEPGTSSPEQAQRSHSNGSTIAAVKKEPSDDSKACTSGAVTPLPPQPPQVASGRPLCQYEGACYRRNEQHRATYSHPGEVDWVPQAQRPICQYDPYCYRNSLAHRVAMRHTFVGSYSEASRHDSSTDSSEHDDDDDDDEAEEEDPYYTDGDDDDDEYRPEE